MINVMNSMKNPLNEGERCLDPQLWHACAGGMVQMPSLNSEVVYFPQGHAEHANKSVDFGNFPKIPPLIPCRVSLIKYLADMETDEVYAKISLNPLKGNEYGGEDDGKMLGFDKNEGQEKPNSFAKTLTQSDANNGGGFSVPRYCAETIFPRLDYSAEPPVQTILVKDVHGGIWKFRHIYRGTPRRHLLTTGWSNFVNQKKLVAGDSIVFLRAEIGDLCIGIRRAKRGIGGGTETVSGWNPGGGHFPASSLYQSFLAEEGVRNVKEIGKVRAESVIEAATLAANGRSFEVVYYPRASTPEFVVKASAVRAAMRVQWCSGMRFKMPFETEDSSRISWFMGTISSVQVDNPINWPNSPWRLLQVAWDEPDLLQNVKRVSPWLVELVSNMPAIHLSPFTPPRKKLRVPQPPDFPFGQFLSNPISPNGQLCYGYSDNNNNIPAGIQGARHAQFGFPSSEFHLNKLQAGLFPFGTFNRIPEPSKGNPENISCLLTIGNSNIHQEKIKKPAFVLFGTTILTEQQIAQSCTVDTVKKSLTRSPANLSDGSGSTVLQNGPSDDEVLWNKHSSSEIGQCKLFLDSEDFGRAIDLTALRSYEELYRKLADMIRLERSDILSNIVYQDIASAVRQIGDQPFSEFVKTARKLTIVADSSSNNVGR